MHSYIYFLSLHLHFTWRPTHKALVAAATVAPPHEALSLECDGLWSIGERAYLPQTMLQSLHNARIEEVKHASWRKETFNKCWGCGGGGFCVPYLRKVDGDSATSCHSCAAAWALAGPRCVCWCSLWHCLWHWSDCSHVSAVPAGEDQE